MTPENLAKVKPMLAAWLPLVKVYDSDSPKTALLNGDVDLGIVWSGEAAILINERPKFKYVLPKEGAHMFIDSLAIPKGAPNAEAAHGVHQLHPAARGEQADLRRLPLHQPEPRSAQAADARGAQQNPASYPPGDPKLATFRDIGRWRRKSTSWSPI